MKKIIVYALVSITVITSACKKKNDTNSTNNNEVNVTVVISPTSTININAKGSKATMGCSFNAFVGTTNQVAGTNENNAAVYIQIPLSSLCVTSPGTYSFSCEYRKNVADPNTPIWANNGINRGSITFTAVNDHYWEGNFNAVCRCVSTGCVFGVDSVIVNGTFKGDHLN